MVRAIEANSVTPEMLEDPLSTQSKIIILGLRFLEAGKNFPTLETLFETMTQRTGLERGKF